MKSLSQVSLELSAVMLIVAIIMSSEVVGKTTPIPEETGGSYLSQARKLFDSGTKATEGSREFSNSVSSDEQRSTLMLRDSISKATELINEYRQNGLSSLPNFPNLPGLTTVMRVPDKLLRAELSMLQDEIRMAQEMMQNPLAATMNVPRDLATMLARIAEQLEQ